MDIYFNFIFKTKIYVIYSESCVNILLTCYIKKKINLRVDLQENRAKYRSSYMNFAKSKIHTAFS